MATRRVYNREQPKNPQDAKGSRVYKAISFGVGTGSASGVESFPSNQILQDPFLDVGAYGVAVPSPPYSMEQMVLLAETHPMHAAAIEQKVQDIVSTGPKFISPNADGEDDEADVELHDQIENWWLGLFEDYTDVETLQVMWSDFETVGWGALEVVRDQKGIVRRLYHVPGHTLRPSYDNQRYLQMRNGKMVWFKKWGVPGQIFAKSGREAPKGTDPDKLATELLVFKKPSRRSSWYGIPNYVSAIGNITLAVAARDYNILFFENSREPRHVFVITGLDEDIEQMLDDLKDSLTTQHKEPHRNLLLPMSGDAKVDIQPLASITTDQQFEKMVASADQAILIAHRMPADRLGLSMSGALSGNVAEVSIRSYKEGVVQHGQQVLEDRLNRFLNAEYPIAMGDVPDPTKPLEFEISFEELDITDEAIDTNIVVAQVANNLITLNEGRKKLGKPIRKEYQRPGDVTDDDPDPDPVDLTQSEYMAKLGMQNPGVQQPQKMAPTGATVEAGNDATMKSRDDLSEALRERMGNLDKLVLELLEK